MKKNFSKRLILLVPLLLHTFGCGPAPTSTEQEPPPPFVSITNVSNALPEIGEAVTVRWQYRQDVRPDLGPPMIGQVYQFISLTIGGEIFFETHGCLPADHWFLGGQTPGECIPMDDREVQFNFAGPVLFRLFAFAEDEPDPPYDLNDYSEYRLAIKLMLPNMSFHLAPDHSQLYGYPYIVWGVGGLHLERAFGIYEVPDENDFEDGIIDEFGPGTELGQVFPTVVETIDGQILAPSFFGSSSRPEESENFGFRKGGNFPLLQEGFFDTPNGQFFRDVKSHADIIILGGGLGVDGREVEQVKADTGATVSVIEAGNVSAVFVQIDVRSANINPRQYFISDLHIIVPSQGLVFSTFADHNSPLSVPTLGQNEISVFGSQPTFQSTGMIKGALTGHDLILELNGAAYSPAQATFSVEWTNIPIYPDNDISGLANTYFP